MKNEELLLELNNKIKNELSINMIKIYLFGSRVNGNCEEYSDYDILIILNEEYDWEKEKRIYDLAYEIMIKYNIIIDIKILSKNEMVSEKGNQPFIQNAINYGVYI